MFIYFETLENIFNHGPLHAYIHPWFVVLVLPVSYTYRSSTGLRTTRSRDLGAAFRPSRPRRQTRADVFNFYGAMTTTVRTVRMSIKTLPPRVIRFRAFKCAAVNGQINSVTGAFIELPTLSPVSVGTCPGLTEFLPE